MDVQPPQDAPQEQEQIDTNEINLNDSFEEEWDGPEKMRCKDLIYKFTLNNNTQTPILYRIKMSQKSEDAPANLLWPMTGVKGKLDMSET